MGLGFELAVATVYIVEIASTDMRGILGITLEYQIKDIFIKYGII